MLENVLLSIKGIFSHKLRSALTMLGIIIGIAAIITIVSTIKGTNDQIKENLIGSGTNVVTVSFTAIDGYYDSSYGDLPEGVGTIDAELKEELCGLDGVETVSTYFMREWTESAYYGSTQFNGAAYGVDENYLSVNSYTLVSGRSFIEEDYADCSKVLVIDERAATNLFSGISPLGRIIEIGEEPFKVIGVVKKSDSSQPTINSYNDYWMYSDTSSGRIFMTDKAWPIVYRYDEVYTLAVRAASTDEMTEAGKNVADALNEAIISTTAYEYKADDLLEQASQLQSLSSSTNTQLIWIAGISLIVGGIGVMNIMLVSVTERTREIGLKKALGAKRRIILWQFLTEAAVLTCLGGLIGVIAGIGLAQLLSGLVGTPASISVPACIIAVAFSMIIGIVFGLVPALKASKLNPIEALRSE